jgi:hypothetical protein
MYLLPAPYLSGYEARSWHEQGMFSPQARGQYLPTSMVVIGHIQTIIVVVIR